MHPLSRLVLSIVLGLTLNLAIFANAAPLILFEDSEFRGVRTEYKLDGPETCVNIRGKLNDLFSSVENTNPNSCFLLCEHEYCRGRCIQVTDSVENLNLLEFNDVVSSIKRCPPSTATPTTAVMVSSSSLVPNPTTSINRNVERSRQSLSQTTTNSRTRHDESREQDAVVIVVIDEQPIQDQITAIPNSLEGSSTYQQNVHQPISDSALRANQNLILDLGRISTSSSAAPSTSMTSSTPRP